MPKVRKYAVLIAGTLLASIGNHHQAAAQTFPEAGTEPFSVQMHVHGPFSEGNGSVDSQTWEAENANVDVIWWSEHDFRLANFHTASTFQFERWTEPVSFGEDWIPNQGKEIAWSKGLVETPDNGFEEFEAELSTQQATQGHRSLRLAGRNDSAEFEEFSYVLLTSRGHFKRALVSNVTAHLAVFPESTGTDTRPFIEVKLSEHAPNDVIDSFQQYSLRYILDNSGQPPSLEGSTYTIPLPFVEGSWNHFRLPLTLDAQGGFPMIDGQDNSAVFIRFGLESRNGARGEAYFDAFKIVHQVEGYEALDAQRRLLDYQEAQRPTVRQLQGSEVSYEKPHMNEFSTGPGLYDYEKLAERSGLLDAQGRIQDVAAYRDYVTSWVSESARRNGGVTSLNHIFGAGDDGSFEGTRLDLLKELVKKSVYGTGVLEVGYSDRAGWKLADYLWIWDGLAKRGFRLVGTGVSDSHGGPAGHWLTRDNNFVSWIYAASTAKADLLEGLKSGRVYFGDIGEFDGEIDLVTTEGFPMGAVVVTDADSVDVRLLASNLNAGSHLVRVIESGHLRETFDVLGDSLDETITVDLTEVDEAFVRFEVYRPDGTEVVFSNPIYFTKLGFPPSGARPIRFAMSGILSTKVADFSLHDVRVDDTALEIDGSANNGLLELDYSNTSRLPHRVELDGLEGEVALGKDWLEVRGISGSGTIRVRHKGAEDGRH